MIYDLLPEMEEFREQGGGAISKNVANVMRFDESRTVVCAAAAADLWGFESHRIVVIPGLLFRGKKKIKRWIPASIKGPWYRRIYEPFLSMLKAGDVVWCHNQPYIAAALERSIHEAGARLIFQSHDPHLPGTAIAALESLNLSAWVFVSDALRKQYQKFFPRMTNTYVVYNGADERVFYPLPSGNLPKNDVPTVLYVGRLHPEKGVHLLVEAMRVLQTRNVDARCKVIGSPYTGGSKPTRYVRSLHSSSPSNVDFLGYRAVADTAREMRTADVFCCPSVWLEAFGNVNIEAMASGTPVVASRVGGIPEIAAEGGILLVAPDSAIEIADALQKLIEDEDLRLKTGKEGLKSFRKRFTWSAIASQYQEIAKQWE